MACGTAAATPYPQVNSTRTESDSTRADGHAAPYAETTSPGDSLVRTT